MSRIDFSQLNLEGIDLTSLSLEKIDSTLTAPFDYSSSSNYSESTGFADMIGIPRLTEKTVISNLLLRFKKNIIFTYIGSVLVCVNPFKNIPDLYENLQDFRGKSLHEKSPHIFALTEKGYSTMLSSGLSQTFLISGESGAGKTETVKKILTYLASISLQTKQETSKKSLYLKILQTNTILENFGNAKTVHNKNSSRFGKFIEIQFDGFGMITGASISDYLLEKTRIVHQSIDERNYHIFYRLLAGLSKEEKELLFLNGLEPEYFNFINNGQCCRIPDINEVEEYEQLKKSLNFFFPTLFIDNIWKIIAAIMHLGNVSFGGTDEKVKHILDIKPLKNASLLLEIDLSLLEKLFLTQRTTVGTEIYEKERKLKDAIVTRNTFCKTIYARLFKWIVSKMNDELSFENSAFFFGILDIFGFEIFKYNCLEQFCINYANEALQNLFNEYLFRIEQEHYIIEDLKVKPIPYVDNIQCLELISSPQIGIFDILEDQTKISNGSINNFIYEIEKNHKKHPNFIKEKKRKSVFSIKHYAGKVTYETSEWIDKNSELTPKEMNETVQVSKNMLLQTIFLESTGNTAIPQRKPSISKLDQKMFTPKLTNISMKNQTTITYQFRKSLSSLIESIKTTNLFFIRCLKPNSEQIPNIFNDSYVLVQMRSVGMLDTIQIRKSGYSDRFVFNNFYEKFSLLLPEIKQVEVSKSSMSIIDKCKFILKELQLPEDDFAFGKTKIFVKEMSADLLENRHSTIQKLQLLGIRNAIRKRNEYKETSTELQIERKESIDKLKIEKSQPITNSNENCTFVSLSSLLISETVNQNQSETLNVPLLVRRKKSVFPFKPASILPEQTLFSQESIPSLNETLASSEKIENELKEKEIAKNIFETKEIMNLYLRHEEKCKKVLFSGVCCEVEFQKLFKTAFPTNSFTIPFPKLHIRDTPNGFSYELNDYRDVRDGCELSTPEINFSYELQQLTLKIERGFDMVKDLSSFVTIEKSLEQKSEVISPSTVSNNLDFHSFVEKVHNQQKQLQQVRREVAICKQLTRKEHQTFIHSLENELSKIIEFVPSPKNLLETKRIQLEKNKKELTMKINELKNELNEFHELVEDTFNDVTKRRVKLSKAIQSVFSQNFNSIETKYNKINEFYDVNHNDFMNLWQLESDRNKNESEEFQFDINNSICDIEEVHVKVVSMIANIQNLNSTREIVVPFFDSYIEEEEFTEVVGSLIEEISMQRMESTERIKAIEKMERNYKKKKEIESLSDPLVQFTKDLNLFKGKLKSSGGIEEIERLRSQKDKELGLGKLLNDH